MTVDRSSPAYASAAAAAEERAKARNVQAVQRARAKLTAQLDRAVFILHPPDQPPSDRLMTAMLASTDLDPVGGTLTQRLSYLQRREPTIVKTFTYSALHAVGEKVPATACRWCVAYRFARKPRLAKGDKSVVFVPDGAVPHELPKSHRVVLRRALGPPCAGCAAAMEAHDQETSRPSSTAGASGPAGQSTPRTVTTTNTVDGITAGAGGPTYRQQRVEEWQMSASNFHREPCIACAFVMQSGGSRIMKHTRLVPT